MTEEAAEFYSKGAEKYAENQSRHNIDPNYLEMIDEFAEKVGSGEILDAGCGHGRDAQILSEKGFKVIGIDLSEDLIGEARKKDGKFLQMDIRDLEFEDEKFDGIISNQVLVFFDNQEKKQIFEELERVLKPGGVIFLGLKKGEEKFKREKFGSSVDQYPITEEKAKNMLNNFQIKRFEITERDKDIPSFMNFIAREIENE